MHSFDYFSVLITSSSTLIFHLVTITSALYVYTIIIVLDISQVYLDDTLALCVSGDISWSHGVATPLKRLLLGGFNQFTQWLKRNL